MKIDFNDCSVLSEDFTKHICVTVLNYYIELEKRIIEDNKNDERMSEKVIVRSSQKILKHLQESKKYIESYYKKLNYENK